MPMLFEYIDAISRKNGRDVLFLYFPKKVIDDPFDLFNMDWGSVPIRQQVIAWLDANQIAWTPCGHFADENFLRGYQGWIYTDVPFDAKDPTYQKLSNYLETPEGEMKLADVKFGYLPLEMAMKNAHHDEPGFWKKWEEEFFKEVLWISPQKENRVDKLIFR